jgi:aspartyl/glutamyl-tRNA(Asn/Gln) amidotransferase C subunit
MASADDVKKLAALARISVNEAELEKFAKEFDGILAYVGKLEELDIPKGGDRRPPVRNVLREDGEPHAAGAFTGAVVAQFPDKEGDSLKVKQIISYD